MAKKRPSTQKRQREYQKRQREMEKAEKATQKRIRRQNRAETGDTALADDGDAPHDSDDDASDPAE